MMIDPSMLKPRGGGFGGAGAAAAGAAHTPDRPSQFPPQEETKKCPFCGQTIARSAIKCRFCNEFLDPRQRETAQQGEEALAAYRSGMRTMGTILYVLGALVLVCGLAVGACAGMAASIAGAPAQAGVIVLLAVGFYFAIAVVYFVLGAFARRLHSWVNVVMLILSSLSACGTLMGVIGAVGGAGEPALQAEDGDGGDGDDGAEFPQPNGPEARANRAGQLAGAFIVALLILGIDAWIIALAIMNLRKLGRVRACGIDPATGKRVSGRLTMA